MRNLKIAAVTVFILVSQVACVVNWGGPGNSPAWLFEFSSGWMMSIGAMFLVAISYWIAKELCGKVGK